MPANEIVTEKTVTHTAGPWTVKVSPHQREFTHFIERPATADVDRLTIAAVVNNNDSAADAHLIAASPALLKACKLALMEFERNAYQKKADPEVVRMIEMAVYKAEGRPGVIERMTNDGSIGTGPNRNLSAMPCGCDPGAAYTCDQHRGTDVQA